MKKTHLIASALIFMSLSAFSQQNTAVKTDSQVQEEIFTPLKLLDPSPAVFTSKQELELKKPLKINGVKDEIRLNKNNPEMVKQLRQQLWRFENAIVIEPKN